uniref:Uncharacterized protein n=1 Tax=Rhizophora mucronata TaxID=61149 RepID=A0A2P2P1R0_RHIMU
MAQRSSMLVTLNAHNCSLAILIFASIRPLNFSTFIMLIYLILLYAFSFFSPPSYCSSAFSKSTFVYSINSTT